MTFVAGAWRCFRLEPTNEMNLHLVDIDVVLVRAWRVSFADFPEVEIQNADILAVATHCIVSPANSHGFMDGGIDDQYRKFFGRQIEQTVQDAILRRPEGMLPVGASLVVHTGHRRVPFMIVAPTMEMPEAVPAIHCARAMHAVLRMVDRYPELNADVVCPGLCTLVGGVAPELAAKQMATAYGDWIRGRRAARAQ